MSNIPVNRRRSSTALKKADQFAANSGNGGARVQAKQAILQELNSQLKAHGEKIRSRIHVNQPSGNDSVMLGGHDGQTDLARYVLHGFNAFINIFCLIYATCLHVVHKELWSSVFTLCILLTLIFKLLLL
jgi:hypothetical protein